MSNKDQIENQGKKPYVTPELKNFGSLSDVVKAAPGPGSDGGIFLDDMFS